MGEEDLETLTAGEVNVATAPVLAVAAATDAAAAATCSPCAAATTAICSISPDTLEGSVISGSVIELSVDEGRESSPLTSILGGMSANGTPLSCLAWC